MGFETSLAAAMKSESICTVSCVCFNLKQIFLCQQKIIQRTTDGEFNLAFSRTKSSNVK